MAAYLTTSTSSIGCASAYAAATATVSSVSTSGSSPPASTSRNTARCRAVLSHSLLCTDDTTQKGFKSSSRYIGSGGSPGLNAATPDVLVGAVVASDGVCAPTTPVAAADVVVVTGVADDIPGAGAASSGACATSAASAASTNVVPGTAAANVRVALDIRVRLKA